MQRQRSRKDLVANSNHCLHSCLEGPARSTSDSVAVTEAATLNAEKFYFYHPSFSLKAAGDDMSKILQVYFA